MDNFIDRCTGKLSMSWNNSGHSWLFLSSFTGKAEMRNEPRPLYIHDLQSKSSLFILRQSLCCLTSLELPLSTRSWPCHPPASTSLVAETTGLCHCLCLLANSFKENTVSSQRLLTMTVSQATEQLCHSADYLIFNIKKNVGSVPGWSCHFYL